MSHEVKTIQLWPRGTNITFSGSYPEYVVHENDSTRAATEDENREIQANELAARYLERDVFCCDSALVSELLKLGCDGAIEGFSFEDIENEYMDTSDMSLEELREYLSDMSADTDSLVNPWDMSREELAELLTDNGFEVYDEETEDELRAAVISNIDDETIDGLEEWREKASEVSQDNPREAYQWFRVSEWLCAKLRGIGEIVIDNEYGAWWGRGCCGQGVLMDGTFQTIARRVLSQ